MYYRRDAADAAARRKAKRELSDASPRLLDRVPRLRTLQFEIIASREGVPIQATRHVKRFPVENAPALFQLDCTDPACRDGGHDLTELVLDRLARSSTTFQTEDPCAGKAGDRPCGRVLRVVATATYEAAAAATRKRGAR